MVCCSVPVGPTAALARPLRHMAEDVVSDHEDDCNGQEQEAAGERPLEKRRLQSREDEFHLATLGRVVVG